MAKPLCVTISAPLTCPRNKVLRVAMACICDVMELTGIVTSLLTHGASALYWLKMIFMLLISASIHVLFCYFLNYFTVNIVKGINLLNLRMCPVYVPAFAYGSCRVSDEGTTPRASDLSNAWVTILNSSWSNPNILIYESSYEHKAVCAGACP